MTIQECERRAYKGEPTVAEASYYYHRPTQTIWWCGADGVTLRRSVCESLDDIRDAWQSVIPSALYLPPGL